MPHSPRIFSQSFWFITPIIETCFCYYFLVFFTIYCASSVVAGAKLFQNIFSVEYSTALWYGAAATIAYTFIGGFLAVSWTDTIQAINDFCINFSPVFVLLSFADTAQFSAVLEQAGAAVNKRFSRIYLLLPHHLVLSLRGIRLFRGQPHFSTLYGCGFCQITYQKHAVLVWVGWCFA